MTTLTSLKLQGIRSFGPRQEDAQSILFHKPLTIILGPNGTGKTTIIEALKQACTGVLPPNSDKGKSFVHDPKLADEPSVKGKIVFQFRCADGTKVAVTRCFELTQLANSQRFKTLDATIQTKQRGREVHTASRKVADVDKMVPEFMQVSKAILENVIFCHQEDSSWPLSTPQELKNRFDDIFASSRYSKALKVIKDSIKAQEQDIKQETARLEGVKMARNELHKRREELEKLRKDVQKLGISIREKSEELQHAERARSEEQAKYDAIGEQSRSQLALRERLRSLNDQIREMASAVGADYKESDEELRAFLQEMEEHMLSLSEGIQELQESRQQKGEHKREVAGRLEQLRSSLSRLQILREQAQELDSRTANAVRELHRDAKMRKAGITVKADQSLAQAMEILGAGESRLQEEFTRRQSEQLMEEKETCDTMNDVSAELSSLKKSAEALKRDEATLSREVSKLEGDIKRESGSHEGQSLARLEAVADKKARAHKHKQAQMAGLQLEERREKLQARRAELGEQLQKLGREIASRESEQQESVQLDLKRKTLQDKEGESQRLLKELQHVIPGRSISLESFQDAFQGVLRDHKSELEQTNDALGHAESTVGVLQHRLDSKVERRAEFQERVKALDKEIRHATEGQPVDELVDRAAEKVNTLTMRKANLEALQKNSETLRAAAVRRHRCNTCKRGFDGAEEREFLEKLERKMKSLPEKLEQLTDRLRQTVDLQEELQRCLPLAREAREIEESKLPGLDEEIAMLRGQRQEEKDQVSSLQERRDACRAQLDKLQEQAGVVSQLTSLVQELGTLRQELDELQAKLGASGARESLSALVQRKDELERERDNTSLLMDEAFQEMEEHRQALAVLHEELQEAQRAVECQRRVQGMLESLQEKREAKAEATREYDQALDRCPELEARVKELEKQLQGQRDRNNKVRAELSELLQYIRSCKQRLAHDLETMHRLEKGIERLQPDSLQAKEADVAQELQRLGEERERQKREMSGLEEDLEARRAQRQEVEEVLRYRSLCEKARKLEAELRQMSEDSGVPEDPERIKIRLEELQRKERDCRSERDTMMGMKSGQEERIHSLQSMCTGNAEDDVDQTYRDLLLKLKTHELAKADLERYCHALERVLLNYHSVKMQEINESIAELWRNTYRGKDIDTIEIKADEECKRRGSHNYRLVMKKANSDAELDMRGRCSAGQKVLAALVVRLALAEAFCINCSVIALDEPTTNLDRENIDSLSESLQRLVSARSVQSNFQLVIITHDQEFVDSIGRREFVDRCYRLSRHPETHCSTIEEIDLK